MPRHSGGPGGSGRKYHGQKRGLRAKSHYKDRLRKRGLSAREVVMESLDVLRKRGERSGAQERERAGEAVA